MKTRVTHIVLNLHAGGLESVVLGLIQGSDPDRFEHSVVVLEYPGRLASQLSGLAEVVTVDMVRGVSMLHPAALVRALRSLHPDVVHLHTGVWHKGSLGAARARVPFVLYTEHGRDPTEPWTRRLKDRLASRRTDLVVAVSDEWGRYLRSRVVDPSTPVVTLTNGIDSSAFVPRGEGGDETLRRELSLPPETLVIGSVGRFFPVKGYDILIRAFATFGRDEASRPAASSAHLVLGGEGPGEQDLRSLAAALGVDSRVHFLGWREDAPRLLPQFDVFALSSRSEGTSMSLLEAMSCGVCPVVTDVGGNRRVLGGDLGHRVVPSEDVDAFAAALGDALRDEAGRLRDGERARTRVLTEYDRSLMIRGYEAVYAERSGAALHRSRKSAR